MRSAPNIACLATECRKQGNAVRIATLRRALADLQGGSPSALAGSVSTTPGSPKGSYLGPGLPGHGLACGVLHELVAAHADRPAAFGFLFALAASAFSARAGPAVLVAHGRALGDFGRPYGHGLAQAGLDPDRLILVETRTEKDALWALEEVLRSQARPAMVMGALQNGLDLTPSRRLNLAAAMHATPLAILRGTRATGTSAAATRWRIASAPAPRDRFGAYTNPRWRVTLERSRNSRPGEWLIEWNHAAYRFRVVEDLADRPSVADEGFRLAG